MTCMTAQNIRRIVQTDNFGMSGESPGKDEKFLLWPMPEEDAKKIVEILNSRLSNHSPDYYKVVDYEYVLSKFEP